MVTALGSIVIQEFIFRNKILLLLLLLRAGQSVTYYLISYSQRQAENRKPPSFYVSLWCDPVVDRTPASRTQRRRYNH